MNKEILINNLEKLHITKLGRERVIDNLCLEYQSDVTSYVKNIILNEDIEVSKKGSNLIVKTYNYEITINSRTFTIITAHLIHNS